MRTLFLVFVVSLSSVSADPCIPADNFTHRGDFDCSGGEPNITDLINLVNFINFGGPPPCCLGLADIDGNGIFTGADYQALAFYLFGGCGACMASPHCLICG